MSFQSMTVEEFFNNFDVLYTSSLSNSSIISANTNPMAMSDVRKIFDGKRVVFAGDWTVRSLYRDMATFLVKGHRLCYSQISLQTGQKICPYINEQRIRAGGQTYTPSYIDERICQWSPSSSLHYIFLGALESEESNELLRLVTNADMVIFSSMRGDMNRKILAQSEIPFSVHLDAYTPKIFSLCQRIVQVARSNSSTNFNPLLLWLTPLPDIYAPLSQNEKIQFLQIVAAGENAAKMAGFQIFDQLNVSLADNGDFLNENRGLFSPVGIRLVSKLLSEIAAEHWQRPIQLPICCSSFSSTSLLIDKTADINTIENKM